MHPPLPPIIISNNMTENIPAEKRVKSKYNTTGAIGLGFGLGLLADTLLPAGEGWLR